MGCENGEIGCETWEMGYETRETGRGNFYDLFPRFHAAM